MSSINNISSQYQKFQISTTNQGNYTTVKNNSSDKISLNTSASKAQVNISSEGMKALQNSMEYLQTSYSATSSEIASEDSQLSNVLIGLLENGVISETQMDSVMNAIMQAKLYPPDGNYENNRPDPLGDLAANGVITSGQRTNIQSAWGTVHSQRDVV